MAHRAEVRGLAGEVSTTFQVARHHSIRRAARDDLPSGFNSVKAGVSTLCQILGESGGGAAKVHLAVSETGVAEAIVPWVAGDDLPVDIGLATVSGLLSDLSALRGLSAFVLLGDSGPVVPEQLMEYSRALLTHRPAMDREAALEYLLPRVAKPPSIPDLVVEERPGRVIVFDSDRRTLRRSAKRWQAMGAYRGRGAGQPATALDGWGIAAFLAAPTAIAPPGQWQSRRLDAVTWNAESPECSPGWAAGFLEQLGRWQVDLKSLDLRSMTISTPVLTLGTELAVAAKAAFGPRIEIHLPEMLFGWQPVITAAGEIAGAQGPALSVYLGGWPKVQVLLCR